MDNLQMLMSIFSKALTVLKCTKTLTAEYSFEATAGLERLFKSAAEKENQKTQASFRDLLVKAQKNHRRRPRSQESSALNQKMRSKPGTI